MVEFTSAPILVTEFDSVLGPRAEKGKINIPKDFSNYERCAAKIGECSVDGWVLEEEVFDVEIEIQQQLFHAAARFLSEVREQEDERMYILLHEYAHQNSGINHERNQRVIGLRMGELDIMKSCHHIEHVLAMTKELSHAARSNSPELNIKRVVALRVMELLVDDPSGSSRGDAIIDLKLLLAGEDELKRSINQYSLSPSKLCSDREVMKRIVSILGSEEIDGISDAVYRREAAIENLIESQNLFVAELEGIK